MIHVTVTETEEIRDLLQTINEHATHAFREQTPVERWQTAARLRLEHLTHTNGAVLVPSIESFVFVLDFPAPLEEAT